MIACVNGATLYYTKAGHGPPFVLLHGNGEDHTAFARLAPLLARQYTVYAIDSRGHGQSGPAGAMHYGAMCADVAAFIAALGLKRPVLLGASDGGIVGLLVAIRHPGLLSKLVVCGANTQPGQLWGWFRLLCRAGYAITGDAKLKMMLTEPDITPRDLGRINVPTLVLAGERDILPRRDTAAIAAAIPGAALRILPGESHGSYIRRGHRLYLAMRGFLAGG